jgi:prophage antirepressor-like protein
MMRLFYRPWFALSLWRTEREPQQCGPAALSGTPTSVSVCHPAWRGVTENKSVKRKEQMNTIPSVFNFNDSTVRVIADDRGEPWFLANDVCTILGYANTSQAVKKNCREGGISKRYTPTESGNQEMIFISEGNLYRLIIKSRKPEAEAFEIKVMEEILPTIRKTGQYIAQPYCANPGDKLTEQQADAIREILTTTAKARYPGDTKKQGAFLMQGWSKLKAHFKVGYRQIPQAELTEAISIVARHAAEVELLDAAPAQGQLFDTTLSDTAQLAAEGFEQITAISRLALYALQNPNDKSPTSAGVHDITGALSAIWGIAENAHGNIEHLKAA